MNNFVEQEVFQLHPFGVVKASYKDSVYYIAGAYDITDHVKSIQNVHADVDKKVLQRALNAFLKQNPNCNILDVPKFDFILLDDPKTTERFVYMYCTDVLRFDVERCEEVVKALNTQGYYKVGTYTDEFAMTLGHLLEAGNEQLKQNLKWDKIEHQDSEKDAAAAMLTLEKLIRRDYPADI
jgi:ATP-dependent Clp protease adapter protein ClpS